MTLLSVVIIAFNEELNISRCLNSVLDIADDIVVVDSGSKDLTVNIAERLGARVVHQEFLGHIEQKNFAITQAKHPHILSLDADEELSPELIESIKGVKENWNFDGYSCNRLNNFCGHWVKHCGWYPDQKLRLWDSSKGKWEGKNPHDEFKMDNNSTKGNLKGDLLHYTVTSEAQHLKQIEYFTDISSQAYFEAGKRATIFHFMLSPVIKFIRDYFIKLGFLDGYYGYIICRNSAKAKYMKYNKLYQLQKKAS